VISSRKIEDLALPARNVCNLHIIGCKAIGIDLIVTSTWRDIEAQDVLYAIGRTSDKSRKPVTNARGGHSWHNFRCAWDVVPLQGGKAVWDDDTLWREIVRIGESCGAEAGSNWKTFPDKPHFQFLPRPPNQTAINLAQAGELFKRHGTIFI